MGSDLFIHVIRFLGLLLLQVLILNDIEITGSLTPYLYPLFILLLPFQTPKWLLLVLGFFLGLLIDIQTNTLGMHASACTFLAFVRPMILQINQPKGDYKNQHPTIASLGIQWFVIYAALGFFSHHLVLYFIDVFSFSAFHITFIKIALATALSLILSIIFLFIFPSRS